MSVRQCEDCGRLISFGYALCDECEDARDREEQERYAAEQEARDQEAADSYQRYLDEQYEDHARLYR